MDPVSQGLWQHYPLHLHKKEIRLLLFVVLLVVLLLILIYELNPIVILFYLSNTIDILLIPLHLFHLVA